MAKFVTQNTALAAYLKTQGFTLLEALTDQKPASFIFEDNEALRAEVKRWQLGTAECNACVFIFNYRGLIKKIHLYQPAEVR